MVKITKPGNTSHPGPWYLFGWNCSACGAEWDCEKTDEVRYERGDWTEVSTCTMECPWCGMTMTYPKWR